MSPKSKNKLYVYLHTHWDREWYEPFRCYQLRLATVVDDLITRLQSGELPCFTLDGQTSLLADLLELRPDLEKPLADLIRCERLHVGPWYTMPDEWLVCGESLLRNLQLGITEANTWGSTDFTGYLPDTFGHTGDMPQLLRHVGIQSAMLWRGVNPSTPLFNWQTPISGEQILSYHLRQGYFNNALHDPNLSPDEQDQALNSFLDKMTEEDFPTLLPIGADHLGAVPTKALQRFQQQHPQTQWVHPHQFCHEVALYFKKEKDTLDTLVGDGLDNTVAYVLPGVWSSHVPLKQANRWCEQHLIHQLEPLLVLAQRDFKTLTHHPQYHAAWRLAWKLLLQNQAHDSIGGCSLDTVHRENAVRFEQIQQLITRTQAWIMSDYLKIYQSHIIANTLTENFSGVISVTWRGETNEQPPHHEGLQLHTTGRMTLKHPYTTEPLHLPQAHLTEVEHFGWLWVDNAPALSVQPIDLNKPSTPLNPVVSQTTETHLTIDNGKLIITINRHTGAVNITDKTSQTTHTNCITYIDEPDTGDSYNRGPDINKTTYPMAFQSAKMIEQGPLVSSIQLSHQIDDPEINEPTALTTILTTTLTLKANDTHLSGETQWMNTQPNHRLQVVFNTGKPIQKITRENHLHEVTCPVDPDYHITDKLPADRFKEVMGQTRPIQRYILANEHLILTEGLTEAEAVGNTLRITLHRGFGVLSSDSTGTRGGHAGPPLPTPRGQYKHQTLTAHWHWAPLSAHSTAQARHQWANQTLTPPSFQLYQGQDKTNHLISTQPFPHIPKGLILRALKPFFHSTLQHQHWDGVLRIQNTLQGPVKIKMTAFLSWATHWQEAHGLEQPLEQSVETASSLLDATEAVSFKQGELKTFLFQF